MNKILKPLFLQWQENHGSTPETEKFYKNFCEKGSAESYKIETGFASAVYDESEEAFSAGFNAAVQLLMGGGQA